MKSLPESNNNPQTICSVCGSSSLKRTIWPDNYFKCRVCGVYQQRTLRSDVPSANLKSNQIDLLPAPLSEDNEKVYLHSKKKLFSFGLSLIERLIGKRDGEKKLLDIGCGYGYFIKLAADTAGWRCEGIEISPRAVKYCREQLLLNVYDKPLGELQLPLESYDAVTMWGVLDLLPYPLEDLRRINHILKSGGIIFLRVNNFSFHRIGHLIGRIPLLRRFGVAPGIVHRYGITSASLRYLLRSAGFTRIKVFNSSPTEGDPYGTGGKLGSGFVGFLKKIYFAISEVIYYITFRRITISSAIMAVAIKK